MSGLVIFEKEEFGKVRTTQNEDGAVLFAAKDICECLEIRDYKQAMDALDDDEKSYANIKTKGGDQDLLVVDQSGLYHLILTSRKPEAKAFRRWITKEVIPSIMSTGKYDLKKPYEFLYKISHLYLQIYPPNSKKGKAARQIADKIGEIADKLCIGKPVYLYDVYAAAVDSGVEKISCDMGSMLAKLVLEAMCNNGYRVVKVGKDLYTFDRWEDESNEL